MGREPLAAQSPAAQSPAVRLREGRGRIRLNVAFFALCVATAAISVLTLIFLLSSILREGVPYLTPTLMTSGPQPVPEEAGIWPALTGTIWVCTLCGLLTLPIGIATAILLEEFRPRNRWGAMFHGLIQLNITNLAGVPSVVYGILGLTAFVGMFGLFQVPGASGAPAFEQGVQYYDQFFSEGERAVLVPVADRDAPMSEVREGMTAYDVDLEPIEVHVIEPGGDYPEDPEVLAYTLFSDAEAGRIDKRAWYYFRLPFGRGVLTGALTLMLVILPIVIISSQEALRAVPSSLRDGARGLGATPWQVVWNVSLPAAIPGIMTGAILAMSRAIGEAAPILIIAGIVYISRGPQHLMDDFTVMPMQIFNWTGRPQEGFHGIAAAAIIVLLLILLSFNAVAVLIRQKLQKPLS
ncbi:PstA family ABC transporter permease [Candidatus Laterigemmans baculatus]|uniref:PstA family ABC transporter permease n=1 Tax=Candidatus Laterigemmans baculatus TaxID=2770505 RepID=UPI0013DA5C51|nr:ABC transporter permease subunit [Candidatus Laterigemmans baculatus]